MRPQPPTCSSTTCETECVTEPVALPEIADLHVERLVRQHGVSRAAAVELTRLAGEAAVAGRGGLDAAAIQELAIQHLAQVLGGQLAAEGRP